MKKTKKHHFTHLDPEIVQNSSTERLGDKKKSTAVKDDSKKIQADLKRVLITIVVSLILLAVFYYLNQKFGLFSRFNSLI